MDPQRYYALTAEQTANDLKTDLKKGLTSAEAQQRLEQYGRNEFTAKKNKSLLSKFLAQFKSFMILVLVVAAAISGVVGFLHGEGFTDAIIILAIIILNACIGAAQEAKAEKSMEALEKLSAPHCKVVRDGETQTIESRDLVPGDLVVLETGDSIPADLRLTESVNLKIQDAALTGESVPEEKFTHAIQDAEVPLADRDNLGFSSSIVTYGRGQGVVIATGMGTEVGKIASMIQSVPDTKTPMQQKLDQLGKVLGIGALVICAVIFLAGVLQKREVLEMFMTAVSLAAAAIPEGLPAVSTIVLAVGVQRLARRNAIVRSLPAVETLGGVTVICSDKTGTLTQNKMTVVRVWADQQIVEPGKPHNSNDINLLATALTLANDTKISHTEQGVQTVGDPTETALVDYAMTIGLEKELLEAEQPRRAEIPFDSERKMMTTAHTAGERTLIYTKGGVDEVLARCDSILINGEPRPLTEALREKIRTDNTSMAASALRVLAGACKQTDAIPEEMTSEKVEQGLTFIGMVGMIDPPRQEVAQAVDLCREAGIKPVMITGDHQITALAIAQSLGIKQPGDASLTGADLDKMDESSLKSAVESVAVYARVAPEHKVRIIRSFQSQGEIVAMTGDGVNDAPALKLADIGVAMGITGTDVSKQAADVVLSDDNFATIVAAVKEGRRIYDNILKAIQFMLSTNVGEVLVLFIAVMAGWATPLLPIHILWINLVTDSLPALALSVDPAADDVMQRKPADPKRGIMSGKMPWRIAFGGMMIAALSLVAYRLGLQTDVATARTMTFAVLAFSQMSHIFNVRSYRSTAFRDMFRNKYLLGAIALVVGLMLIVIEIPAMHEWFKLAPLSAAQWWWVAGLSLAPLPVVEVVKMFRRLRPAQGE